VGEPAGRRLATPARSEAPGSWKRRELLQAEVQLPLKDPRRSARSPRCSGSVALALRLLPVLALHNLVRLHFLARVRSAGGLQAPSPSPRGTVTTHAAPWGQCPKQRSRCWAATGSLQDRSFPGDDVKHHAPGPTPGASPASPPCPELSCHLLCAVGPGDKVAGDWGKGPDALPASEQLQPGHRWSQARGDTTWETGREQTGL